MPPDAAGDGDVITGFPGPLPEEEGTSSELDSIVQPGHLVFDYEVPPELPGTLTKTGVSLSDGAYGDVYQGYWRQDGKLEVIVAIKCIRRIGVGEDGRFMRRFKRETVVWQAAKHRNILPFLGYQIINGIPMLVSPWCKNGDLTTYIADHPELTVIQRLRLLRDAARGLAHLHSLEPPIAHGDVKPENIIVMDTFEAAFCDFGVSRVVVELDTRTGLTTSGANRGTAGYQSKEVIEDLPLTTMCDVFAFGGVALATLSGKRPFWRMRTDSAIAVAILCDIVPQPVDHPTLPESDTLWRLFHRCWNPVPEARPLMVAVLEELEKDIQVRNVDQVS